MTVLLPSNTEARFHHSEADREEYPVLTDVDFMCSSEFWPSYPTMLYVSMCVMSFVAIYIFSSENACSGKVVSTK